MRKPAKVSPPESPLFGRLVNLLLLLINFFLCYFLWVVALPQVVGLVRILSSWVVAYLLTVLIVYATRPRPRLAVTLLFIALLLFVLLSAPGR
jgi:hypothetical protein